MVEERECVVCGRIFQPNIHNQIICSDECRRKRDADRKRKEYIPVKKVDKTCVWCGDSFLTTEKSSTKTCPKCREDYKRKQKQIKRFKKRLENDDFSVGTTDFGEHALIEKNEDGSLNFNKELRKIKAEKRRLGLK